MGWVRRFLAISIVLSIPLQGIAQEIEYRVLNEGRITPWWRLADGVDVVGPGYPEKSLSTRPDVCLALGYVIQRDGTVADPFVVKRWSSAAALDNAAWEDFGRSAVGELQRWRFVPVEGAVARPTFTVATFFFSGGETTAVDLREQCRIDDVHDALVNARQAAYDRGSLNREWLDRAYRETLRREIRANQANRCRLSHSMAEDCFD